MTANDHPSANLNETAADGTADVSRASGFDGFVPITVWRLDEHTHDGPAGERGAGFEGRVARRIVEIFSRVGEVVIDFDADQNLQAGATALARSHLAISDASQLADLDAITEPVSLIVLRWPRRPTTPNHANVTDLFAGCRLMMTADTCAMVTMASAGSAESDPTNAAHMRELLSAARAVGLVHVLEIVAVRGSCEGDQFLYYASRAEADAVRNEIRGDQRDRASRIDLLVFSTERPRHE